MRYAGKKFLVMGLGASGVAAARYLLAEGAEVHVTDGTRLPAKDAELSDKILENNKYYGEIKTDYPLEQYESGVVSPGISLQEPLVQRFLKAGVPVIGDIELFARAANAPVIGITGSNGKSTVTTLVGEMAKAAGLRVGVGGNLGTPALDLLRTDAQLYVLELSSFQLETTRTLRCKAATLLNLSQDHLDRHGTMENYAAAKARIWNGCEVCVANSDEPAVMKLLPEGENSANVVTFGLDSPKSDHAERTHYGLMPPVATESWIASYGLRHGLRGWHSIIPTSQLKIYGLHNVSNALASLALAEAAGIPLDACLRALSDFRGLPHRCEFVAEVAGARYFNDSKGTNVGSTLAALKGLPAPIVWLAGGLGKGQSFVELREVLAQKGRAAILFGQDAAQIERDIFGALPVYRETTMSDALNRARSLAQPSDSVLLSPACASFDQFKSYNDRGQQFMAQVRNWS